MLQWFIAFRTHDRSKKPRSISARTMHICLQQPVERSSRHAGLELKAYASTHHCSKSTHLGVDVDTEQVQLKTKLSNCSFHCQINGPLPLCRPGKHYAETGYPSISSFCQFHPMMINNQNRMDRNEQSELSIDCRRFLYVFNTTS